MYKVGFVGIGKMGTQMVSRLRSFGLTVQVWNRDRSKLAEVIKQGAHEAASLPEIARNSESIIICLTDELAVETVVFGKNGESGIASQGRANQLLIDVSSISPGATHRFAKRLKNTCGMNWIDAPVSGGPRRAREGAVAMMIGGNKKDLDRAQHILLRLTPQINHVGPTGAGQTVKLCNQIILGESFITVSEAVRFGEANQVSSQDLCDAVNQGLAQSPFVETFSERISNRNYHPALGTTAILLKSLKHIDEVVREKKIQLPLTNTIKIFYDKLYRAGHGDKEPSAFVDFFESKGSIKQKIKIIDLARIKALCNKIVVCCLLIAIIEAIQLAKVCDINAKNLPRVFKGGFADSYLLQILGNCMAKKDYDGTKLGTFSEWLEELQEINKIAKLQNLSLPFLNSVIVYYQILIADGANQDVAAFVHSLAQQSPTDTDTDTDTISSMRLFRKIGIQQNLLSCSLPSTLAIRSNF